LVLDVKKCPTSFYTNLQYCIRIPERFNKFTDVIETDGIRKLESSLCQCSDAANCQDAIVAWHQPSTFISNKLSVISSVKTYQIINIKHEGTCQTARVCQCASEEGPKTLDSADRIRDHQLTEQAQQARIHQNTNSHCCHCTIKWNRKKRARSVKMIIWTENKRNT
jgi:hypothetical protein